jgi:hypothetical protein
MAGNPLRRFDAQRINIKRDHYRPSIGIDGRVSTATVPTKISWHGGRAKEFEGVTHAQIFHNDKVLLEGELNQFAELVRDVADGVTFAVLESPIP